MNCLVVLFVAGVVVCASAKKEADSRPNCFRDLTADEKTQKEALWKTCEDSVDKELKNKEKVKALFGCVAKAKGLVNDQDEVVLQIINDKIDTYGIETYKQELKAHAKECYDKSPKAEDYFKCCKDKQKDLKCKVPKHHCHKGKGKDSKDDTDTEVPEP